MHARYQDRRIALTGILPKRLPDLQGSLDRCVVARCLAILDSVRLDTVANSILNFAASDGEVAVGKDVVYPFVWWISITHNVSVIVGIR